MCKLNILFSKSVPSALLPTFYYYIQLGPHLHPHLFSFDLEKSPIIQDSIEWPQS
ncbi:hypothetical protein GYMLUDRAFT_414363 [Collybiopsis luxurians FD-317 M1]|nr:hypothetical protein GYMLUDRAFT_414363 [Collybiopsis luxurians FD-317 M1]